MAETRVKDFTYYPLSEVFCAFRVLTSRKRQTYRQCGRSPQIGIAGYRFCKRHAEYIRTIVSKDDE